MKNEMKPSKIRIERAMAHARAIARKANYNGPSRYGTQSTETSSAIWKLWDLAQ